MGSVTNHVREKESALAPSPVSQGKSTPAGIRRVLGSNLQLDFTADFILSISKAYIKYVDLCVKLSQSVCVFDLHPSDWGQDQRVSPGKVPGGVPEPWGAKLPHLLLHVCGPGCRDEGSTQTH